MPAAQYRLDGIYSQRQQGFFMQRVKLYGGVISAEQARMVARVAAEFGRGTIHLTTRGSMEIHWLSEGDLAEAKRRLGMVGLTSRGACGGAVRGISCSSLGQDAPAVEALAARLHRHFTANPRFEGLPKKFKICVEADAGSRRHLIQDIGLVLKAGNDEMPHYDVWAAGGLGREPVEGFLLAEDVPENRLIPLIEATLRVYMACAKPGKRLKHVAAELGQAELKRRIFEGVPAEELPHQTGLPANLVPPGNRRIRLAFFAGEVTADELSAIAAAADCGAGGVMVVAPQQDIILQVDGGPDGEQALAMLEQAGLAHLQQPQTEFRICPGAHECRVGISATRDVARSILERMSTAGSSLSWAISGCPNSCTQPQLSDVGIVTARITRGPENEIIPLFDLYRASGTGFGTRIIEGLHQEELLNRVEQME